MGFVGLCVFEDSGPNPKARCLIAAAGPIVNLGVAGLCLPFAMMSGANGPREPIAVSIVVMNAIMCVGNLLPAFPLDTCSTADALLTDLLAGHKRRNAQRRPTS